MVNGCISSYSFRFYLSCLFILYLPDWAFRTWAISTYPLASSSVFPDNTDIESITNIFHNMFSPERNTFCLFTAGNKLHQKIAVHGAHYMHWSNSMKMTNSAIFYQWEERAEHVWRTGDLKRRHFRNSLMILSLLLLSSRQATSAPMYKSSGGSLPILLLWLKWSCNRIAFEFWDVSIWIQLVIKSRNTSHIGS